MVHNDSHQWNNSKWKVPSLHDYIFGTCKLPNNCGFVKQPYTSTCLTELAQDAMQYMINYTHYFFN